MNRKASVGARERILEIAMLGQEGHIGSSFSIVEILLAILDHPDEAISPASRSEFASRALEHFILSKGHAALALYAVLVETGVLSLDEFANFAEAGSNYGGHPTRMVNPAIRASTGSLGHGLPICAGLALAAQQRGSEGQFVCLCGDGEINEGSIWESLLLIGKFKLTNLSLIIDNNRSSTRAIDLGDIAAKLRSFGMATVEVDGHDVTALREVLQAAKGGRASAIVANTIKGHGSKVTAGSFAWHHRIPSRRDVEEIRNGFYI